MGIKWSVYWTIQAGQIGDKVLIRISEEDEEQEGDRGT